MNTDETAADRRQRIISALASAMSNTGLDDITVSDVVSRARITSEAFHEQFDSIRDCWRAGFEDLAVRLEDSLTHVPDTGAPLGRFNSLLDGFLGTIARDTVESTVYLAQLQTADPQVTARAIELQTRLVTHLVEIFDAHTSTERFACQVLAAATTSLTTQALIEGDADAVRNLRGPLILFAEQTLV